MACKHRHHHSITLSASAPRENHRGRSENRSQQGLCHVSGPGNWAAASQPPSTRSGHSYFPKRTSLSGIVFQYGYPSTKTLRAAEDQGGAGRPQSEAHPYVARVEESMLGY